MSEATDDVRQPELLSDAAMRSLAPAASCAYFLDVDGTLLDIKPHPDDVIADPELCKLLVALRDKAGGALALVSGRTLSDIDRIFSPFIFPAAGTHGATIRFEDGSLLNTSGDALRTASRVLEAFVAQHSGLLFEDKGPALTVHFRQNPELRMEVLALLAECAAGKDLVVLEGKMVAELKLTQFNKGTAVQAFMAQPQFKGRRPVFIGDDVTDEYGFDAVNRLKGFAIRVDRIGSMTKAAYRLMSPSDVRAQLGSLLG
jgi:trehalose 6-phosphate phosphatase